MILLEVLLILLAFCVAVYLAFFSKRAQKAAEAAVERREEIETQVDDSATGIAERLDKIKMERKIVGDTIIARKAEVADEAASLDKLSSE